MSDRPADCSTSRRFILACTLWAFLVVALYVLQLRNIPDIAKGVGACLQFFR